jgi:FkbM family methyltransferase
MVLPRTLQDVYRNRPLIPRLAEQNLRKGEFELRLLPILCDRRRASIDVGGYEGAYAFYMAAHSRRCHVFEAQSDLAITLSSGFRLNPRVRVYNLALSDSDGDSEIRTPVYRGEKAPALATIEPGNQLSDLEYSTETVRHRRLDSLISEEVGFIKVDVEGHELSVLRGASQLLARSKPVILVEAEERHRKEAIGSLVSYLTEFGYRGWFVEAGRLHEIAEFRLDIHQRPEAIAITNKVPGAVMLTTSYSPILPWGWISRSRKFLKVKFARARKMAGQVNGRAKATAE